ncbi:TPA: DsbA family oxidoreductase [Pseudomonas aeruginosa]|nr:DsbA family oxidoreductase [Stenotrophomonas sp.]HEJ1322160.1 DsbA family oxidoreductase [Pseudomonas aeruginosa]
MKTVRVDLWSDFVCPWCWIAKRRLEKAVERLSGEVQVIVTNHAYRLARGMEPTDFASALKMKFGSERQAQQMMETVTTHGAMEGLTYNFGTMRFGDTLAAHSLVKSAGTEAERNKMIEALSLASITNGQNIFDHEVLRGIAAQVGMSAERIAGIDFNRIHEIEQDEMRANSVANGVPLFILNDKAYVSGAQPVEAFVSALRQTAIEAPASLNAEDGASCGIDGCRI